MPISTRLETIFGQRSKDLIESGLLGLSSQLKLGTNVFSEEWDLLVVLDTCRVDALKAVSSEYDFLPETVPAVWSVGSATREWIGNTFVAPFEDEISSTAVISENQSTYWGVVHHEFNAHPDLAHRITDWDIVNPEIPLLVDPVWQYVPSDPWTGLPMPDFTTHRAIDVGRRENPDRCMVHYLPPHSPYRSRALEQNRPLTEVESDPWESLRTGSASKQEVWDLYVDELR